MPRGDFLQELHRFFKEEDIPWQKAVNVEEKIRQYFGCEVVYIHAPDKSKRNREMMGDFLKTDRTGKSIDKLCRKYGVSRETFRVIRKESHP